MAAPGKVKTIYVCTSCGEVSPRWQGRCPSCGEWNTLVEDVVREKAKKTSATPSQRTGVLPAAAVRLSAIPAEETRKRLSTGISEMDRVLGGGIVQGSLMLLGGEPGSGKSTLLLQICGNIGARGAHVLYVSGEESPRQIKLRALRLGVEADNLLVASATDIEEICTQITAMHPDLVVVDSIQTMQFSEISSSPGSVSQVRECTSQLLTVAKGQEIPIFIVGHVNKDGAIAGPKVMEHIVDTVLYFEGDRTLPYRILRGAKNRFGSTNEIGMFDMTEHGLAEITNPSQLLLEGRPLSVSGNCVTCTMEGTRPILSEIQALVSKSAFAAARRTASGIDYNRMNLLLAVIEKRAGFLMGGLDVYLNIVGGLALNEPACDLAVALAIISSVLDKPTADDMVAMGEVGLGGEVRSIPNIENRLREAARAGFKTAIIPHMCLKKLPKDGLGIEVIGVSSIRKAVDYL